MRIWSLHPKYLDRQGLTACWREGLLAQKVLQGSTKGYKNHPQLLRFKSTTRPLTAIATYLHAVVDEAERREYNYERGKICMPADPDLILTVTNEQMNFEWHHLLKKLQMRSVKDYDEWRYTDVYQPHPLFNVVPGEIEAWERI